MLLETSFFAPTQFDLIDNLIAEYKGQRNCLETVSASIQDNLHVMHHFMYGNAEERRGFVNDMNRQFNLENAVRSLNATYWNKALDLTDVKEYMPQGRRDEWNEQIRKMETPEFNDETVRPTLTALLNSRQTFFAERVDGIFRGLSRDHVTNRPEGFGKRMIISNVFDQWGTICYRVSGLIEDLQKVIAKFMGRDEPNRNMVQKALNYARTYKTGEWVPMDGGSIRVRAYLKGTVHIEIHPELAWRLNSVLAYLYPTAIPSEFRVKPKRKLKSFTLIDELIPFKVLGAIENLRKAPTQTRYDFTPYTTNVYNRMMPFTDDKDLIRKVREVLTAIGGVSVMTGKNKNVEIIEFDYDPSEVIAELITTGTLPERKSHQFYPTPDSIVDQLIEEADIQEGHRVLEPSAGQGNIALRAGDNVQCVEISKLHCTILESKGLNVINSDFIEWAEKTTERFDRVVMNPPFSEGRAKYHVETAAGLLVSGGKLVSVVPVGCKDKIAVEGCTVRYTQVFKRAFANASVDTLLVIIEKA